MQKQIDDLKTALQAATIRLAETELQRDSEKLSASENEAIYQDQINVLEAMVAELKTHQKS